MDLEQKLDSTQENQHSKLNIYLYIGTTALFVYATYKLIEKGIEIVSPYLDWHNYINF